MSPVAAARAARERAAPLERGTLLAYAAYTALLFLIALAATFPHELLVRHILARAATGPVTVTVRGVRLGWTLAYVIDEFALGRRDGDPAVPLLTATDVRLAPSLLGLVRGHPYPLGVRARLYDGTLDGRVDLRPGVFALDATARDLDVARYAGLRLFMEGTLRGRVDGTIALASADRRPGATEGTVALDVTELAVEGGKVRGITVPDLSFAEVRLAGTIRGGRLEVTDLVANGDQLALAGTGNIVLRDPLAASLMSLELALTPRPAAPEGLRLALNLVPGTARDGGGRTVVLAGALGAPRLR